MEPQAGVRISTRAFIQSLVILFVFMMVAGLLTRIVPAGAYDRLSVNGREVIDPASYRVTPQPDYPIWRWFTAPVEVLGAPGNLTIIVIIIFILFIGSSFAVLDRSGIVRAAIGRIVGRFGREKYALLLVISFFFMALGAFFGIFEEVVPLVPVMVALSYSLGWDALVGLGMSVLATNLGFSAAITNPFTIGVAQKLAELPTFSGWWLRVPIFLVIYVLFAVFLTNYARSIERDPTRSPVYREDLAEREKYRAMQVGPGDEPPRVGRALVWFGAFTLIIPVVLVAGPFIPALSDYMLPVMGLLFFFAGVGAGLLSGVGSRTVGRALIEGWKGVAACIPLILMAASIRHIVVQGGIMDTILHWASRPFSQASPLVAVLAMYGLTLILEFFVPSGSAKAFLMMPILLPLGELLGITRQTIVLAYCFGDGFSNMVYPTNAVLLISLGLTSVSYPKWLKWSLPLWVWVVLTAVVFMAVAAVIRYGPF